MTLGKVRLPLSDDLSAIYGLLGDAGAEWNWRSQALCAQTDPELWFPEKGGTVRDAKLICKMCPVRERCLEFALEQNELYGIYGGLTVTERRRLRRKTA